MKSDFSVIFTYLPILATASGILSAAEPAFVTSDPNGGWAVGGYYVHNNMWNRRQYTPCTSTLYATSHDNWYVRTRMNNQSHDGAVKTYPNVHKDFDRVPIGAFEAITSRFSATSPQVGIYNVAYDLWLNGIAKPGCTEIMVWTENFNQVPGGERAEDVLLGGRSYQVYRRKDSGYIAFVAKIKFVEGTIDLLEMIKWAMARGWLAEASTLNQICFGVEMVSTDDLDATFRVTAFSIDVKLRSNGDNASRVEAASPVKATPSGNGK